MTITTASSPTTFVNTSPSPFEQSRRLPGRAIHAGSDDVLKVRCMHCGSSFDFPQHAIDNILNHSMRTGGMMEAKCIACNIAETFIVVAPYDKEPALRFPIDADMTLIAENIARLSCSHRGIPPAYAAPPTDVAVGRITKRGFTFQELAFFGGRNAIALTAIKAVYGAESARLAEFTNLKIMLNKEGECVDVNKIMGSAALETHCGTFHVFGKCNQCGWRFASVPRVVFIDGARIIY